MTDTIAKLPLETADIVNENIDKLCRLFPEIISEGGGASQRPYRLRQAPGDSRR